ncbi:MAG: ABC transporter ATP-binding protein/permease [Mollicutes bacterium]|nr:ABC transporter ATP-binding protein/permease [Mollicutes bacterium]
MKHLLKYFKPYLKETILAPTFKLCEALLELLIPIIITQIIDKGIGNNDTTYIIKMVALMVLCGITGLAFSITAQYFSAKASVGFCTKLRYDIYNKIQSLTFTDIDKLGSSSMITRMTSDVNQVQTGINLTLRLLLRSPFVVFGAAILASILSPSLAYVFWITIGILLIVVFSIILISIPLHRKVQLNLDEVLQDTRENLTGVRVIRAFTNEESEIKEYNEVTKILEKSQNKVSNIASLMNPLTYVIINIAIVLLIYVGAIKVNDGILSKGEVVALYNYMSQILVELIKFANLVITITKAIACAKRLNTVLGMESRVTVLHQETDKAKAYIEFDHVYLNYQDSSIPSLEDISFKVNKGETIGIIGGTGSGKTSLVNLLTRFYDSSKGSIYIDTHNIESYEPEYLRDNIGVVMQKAVLFKGTIKENICLGLDKTDEEVLEACKIAQCIDVINKKENGLNALVEQNGRNFSGGQRQRLSIARAIVKKPKILILDDSASALDYATEASLRKALKNMSFNPTTFIISQRTSSIKHADKIIVLDDGKLVGFDTHDNLLQTSKVYQEIYYSQFKKESGINE